MPADIDTLLSLAREVGATVMPWTSGAIAYVKFPSTEKLAAFAERIRQDEREKCACIVEDEAVDWEATRSPEDAAYNNAIDHCAAAIRSSGTSQSNPLRGGGNG